MFRFTEVAEVLIVVAVIFIRGSPVTLQVMAPVEDENVGDVLIQNETFAVPASSAVPVPFNVASILVMLLGDVV